MIKEIRESDFQEIELPHKSIPGAQYYIKTINLYDGDTIFAPYDLPLDCAITDTIESLDSRFDVKLVFRKQ